MAVSADTAVVGAPGKNGSAKLLAQLPEAEMEELSTEIARLGLVDPEASNEVITEFHALTKVHQRGAQGGMDVAREMLIASVGEERAREIMDRLSAVVTDVPFSFLGHADPRQVVSFLQQEHPQRVGIGARKLRAQQRGDPVFAYEVAHWRAPANARDQLVFFLLEHRLTTSRPIPCILSR